MIRITLQPSANTAAIVLGSHQDTTQPKLSRAMRALTRRFEEPILTADAVCLRNCGYLCQPPRSPESIGGSVYGAYGRTALEKSTQRLMQALRNGDACLPI